MIFQKRCILILGSEPQSLINFRKNLIQELLELEHRVVVAAASPNEKQRAILEAMGAEVRHAAFLRGGMNPVKDMSTILQLVGLFSSVKPDVVIAYTAKPVIYGAIAGRIARVQNFCAMITGLGYSFIDGPEAKRKFARMVTSFLYKWAFKYCPVILFQNPDDRAYFQKLGLLPRRSTIGLVNGSGVDIDYFALSTLPADPVFLMIARLLVDKGIREYVEAARKLRDSFPNVRTQILGGLDSSPNSVTQEELNSWIEDGIEYLGQVEDVRASIAGANVIVLPSYREGTPRSVLEGMAMGRAIITTDAPGCRETVVQGENGLLVAPRDSVGLFEAMVKLASDEGLRAKMGAKSRKRAVEKYDAIAVARSVISQCSLDQ
jgi:glycosyltransferase involved in cell wall biosynthesis